MYRQNPRIIRFHIAKKEKLNKDGKASDEDSEEQEEREEEFEYKMVFRLQDINYFNQKKEDKELIIYCKEIDMV